VETFGLSNDKITIDFLKDSFFLSFVFLAPGNKPKIPQVGFYSLFVAFKTLEVGSIKLRSQSMYPSLIVVAKKSAAPSALRIQDAKSKLTHSDAWPCLTANELFKD
jgi:hypothetical protein